MNYEMMNYEVMVEINQSQEAYSSPSLVVLKHPNHAVYSVNNSVIRCFLKDPIFVWGSIFVLYSFHNLTPVEVINFSAMVELIFGGRKFEAPLVLYECMSRFF